MAQRVLSTQAPASTHIAHNERIAQLDTHTAGLVTILYTLYAPSTVANADEDFERKESFWSTLDTILASHPHHKKILLAGDLSSRLHTNLDPSHYHIGPHFWGKPQHIADHRRDSAEYLHAFLMSHSFILPYTFIPSPARKKITYKELTHRSKWWSPPHTRAAFHRRLHTQCFALRLPPQHKSHATVMQPLQYVLQPKITKHNVTSCNCNVQERTKHIEAAMTVRTTRSLWCTVMWCSVLVMYCFGVHCYVMSCDVMYCHVMYCDVMYCDGMYCFVVHCSVMYCFVMYCFGVHCYVMSCDVMYCHVMYCDVM